MNPNVGKNLKASTDNFDGHSYTLAPSLNRTTKNPL